MLKYIKKTLLLTLTIGLTTLQSASTSSYAADDDDPSCWNKQACFGFSRGQCCILAGVTAMIIMPFTAIFAGSFPGAKAESPLDGGNCAEEQCKFYGGGATYNDRVQFMENLPKGCDSHTTTVLHKFRKDSDINDPLGHMPVDSHATLYKIVDGAVSHVSTDRTTIGTTSVTHVILPSDEGIHKSFDIKLNPQGIPTSIKHRNVPHSDYTKGVTEDGKITIVAKKGLSKCYDHFSISNNKKEKME